VVVPRYFRVASKNDIRVEAVRSLLGRINAGALPAKRLAVSLCYFDPPLSFSFCITSSMLKLAAFCRCG
jgi:hypothetical protein